VTEVEDHGLQPVIQLESARTSGGELELRFAADRLDGIARDLPVVWRHARDLLAYTPSALYLELNHTTTHHLIDPGTWYSVRPVAPGEPVIVGGLALWLGQVAEPDWQRIKLRPPTDAEIGALPRVARLVLDGREVAFVGDTPPTGLIVVAAPAAAGALAILRHVLPVPTIVVPSDRSEHLGANRSMFIVVDAR
jgi:hypothetical protein